MKKITFGFFMFLLPLLCFAQPVIDEGFEGAAFPPTTPGNWAVLNNGVGLAQEWTTTTNLALVHSGTKAATISRGNIGAGNTSVDWLVTPQITIPANGQLKFFTRQFFSGPNGTVYEIRVSTDPDQTNQAAYTSIQTWSEAQLNVVYDQYEEKVVDLNAFANQQVYVAFVKTINQPTISTSGDTWFVDDVKIVQQCAAPTILNTGTITSTTASLLWVNNGTATEWEIECIPQAASFTGTATATATTNPYTHTGLIGGTPYQFQVRSKCGTGNYSPWVGPFNFTTKPPGSLCNEPIPVPILPYQLTGANTANSADFVDTPQGGSCGALPTGTNYFAGNDVFYSYTATTTGLISVTMTPIAGATNSSLFVYNGCSNIGVSCITGMANTGSGPRAVTLTVTAGQTYTIAISSAAATQTFGYNLLIQREDCVPKPTALTASNFGINSADLSWTSDPTFSTWEVAVQTLGSAIPSGAGEPATNPFTKGGLTAATQYQYWVRAECSPGSGIFTAWAGPYPFNTLVCAPTDACTHTFRMRDTANNGWNGATMQVRQNGIVIQTIGSTFTTGGGPVDVTAQLCNGVPFDLVWSNLGTQPTQCRVEILNSFGQTIFPSAGSTAPVVGTVVYTNTVNCTTPRCDIAPTNVTTVGGSITTTSATLTWAAPSTTSWDIYIVPATDPAPTATSIPTYDDVSTNPFPTTIPLLPDTVYNVYIRVNCSPDPSVWSLPGTFTTLATCIKAVPQPVVAATITTTSATLTWTNGTPTDNSWEILLIPGPNVPPTPPVNPVITGGTILIPTTSPSPMVLPLGTLTPATIYYYYIRTVCSPTDKSVWTLVPIKFNTITCAAADKCTYKFIMTDSGNNGWEGGRMEVRQNGILISTIGASITGAGPTTFNVPLCTNVPFELVWTVAGTNPSQIGISIQNPFTDIVYTKPATDLTLGTKFTSTAICSPPTCPKPTNLVVVNIGQTTAELNWTEMGTATQWEVYVAPINSPAPVNGTPVNGTGFYHIVNAPLSYTVTGLTVATDYIYYVRAICSPTDVGTWTILNPKTFTTKPVNDECAFAINVPVNPAQVCIQDVSGATFGATASAPTVTGTDCGTSDDDVWFKFTATNNIHIINLSSIVGGAINHTVFSGDCSTLVKLYCSGAAESVATGLTIGQVYYVRVYTAASTAGQTATFKICIKTPPPPATNNECATALPITVNLNSICNNVTAGNIIGATASLPAPSACTGTADDDVWFSFVATSSTHFISLLNLAGTTTDLNHAVYSGACGSLVQQYCSDAGSLNSNSTTFVVGQTYFIRIWSNSAASQVVTFDICIKSISTCASAEPFCGADEAHPYMFDNTTGVGNTGHIGCLFTTPNPTYYTLHIGQTGPIVFNIQQYDSFLPDGTPVGNDHDVDFVAWGPFTTPQSCNQISFTSCPTCPNNTANPNFYPFGNILDCSYDGSFNENLNIPNAQAGEYYVILVTNFSNQPGQIKLVQTNASNPGAGVTICCSVGLGPDQTVCGTSTILNALLDVDDINNVPDEGSFQWFYNGSIIPIPGEVNSTYIATQSGTYKVKGQCGLNPVDDEIILTLGPVVDVTSPADYKVCDDATNDGYATFDLTTLNSQVLLTLDPALYTVTYHVLQADANIDTAAINALVPFTNTVQFTQTIYIRVESVAVPSCFDVVPVNLVVSPYIMPTFTLPTNICQNTTAPVLPLTSNNGVSGTWSITTIDTAVVGMVHYEFYPEISQTCAVMYTIDITIDPEIKAAFTQIPNICQSSTPPALPLTSDNGVTGTWNPATIDTSVAGTFHFDFVVDAGQTCALPPDNGGMDIVIDPLIAPAFTAIADVCINTTAPILPTTSDNGITGTWVPSTVDMTVAGTVTYMFTPDAGQCASTPTTPSLTITVAPLTVPNFANIPNICSGTIAPVLATTSPNGVTGTWNGPINTALIGTTPYTFTPTTGLCANVQTLNVTIIQTVTPNFAAIPAFCEGTTAPLLATTSPNGVLGTWSPPIVSNTSGGTYTFTPSTIPGQCAVPVSLITTVIANPDFEIKGECDGTSYVLQALPLANYDVTAATYSWTDPNGLNAGNTQSIIATAVGMYTCVITYQSCSGDGQSYVDRISCTIQKGISPNGDGLNENFDLSGLGVKQLSIFNRYGTKVYSLSNYVDQWKGQTDKGNELPDGTYYYVIDQNNGETQSGWIYINR